jgi:hypothetical protein
MKRVLVLAALLALTVTAMPASAWAWGRGPAREISVFPRPIDPWKSWGAPRLVEPGFRHGSAPVPRGRWQQPGQPHPQPVWIQPSWHWDGWQWVWVPGYWTWW